MFITLDIFPWTSVTCITFVGWTAFKLFHHVSCWTLNALITQGEFTVFCTSVLRSFPDILHAARTYKSMLFSYVYIFKLALTIWTRQFSNGEDTEIAENNFIINRLIFLCVLNLTKEFANVVLHHVMIETNIMFQLHFHHCTKMVICSVCFNHLLF